MFTADAKENWHNPRANYAASLVRFDYEVLVANLNCIYQQDTTVVGTLLNTSNIKTQPFESFEGKDEP